MALAAIPSNFYVQQANRQVYLTWDLSAGALSYSVERSTDGITYAVLATPTVNNYLDLAVTVGIEYFYKVASVNVSGISPYTSAQSTVPTPTGEMSLGQIRLLAQQRADRVNSNFVSTPEWNQYINQSMFELYDILVTADEEYFVAPQCLFTSNGQAGFLYPLPDGNLTFQTLQGTPFVPEPFYKLKGVDLGLNFAQNAFVTINKFNFIDRNRFVYPNTSSTIYGVFNLQYRLNGNNLQFIPDPTAGQPIRLWYIPRLHQLLKDTDITVTSISGWIEYVIVDAAIKALQKEESDVSVLMAQKMQLTKRIEETAVNRDTGQPDRISDTASQYSQFGFNGPFSGFGGGW